MFSEEIADFCRKCGKEVVLDSCVLILLLVGSTDKRYIKKHKATKKFSEKDYLILEDIVDRIGTVLTTPNILTEVSNLAGQNKSCPEKFDNEIFFKTELFKKYSTWISDESTEKFLESNKVSNDHAFNRLGLTDSAILKLLDNRSGVITTDLKLYLELESRKLPVFNFSNLMILNSI